jgi:ribose transport system ATP-binding protein
LPGWSGNVPEVLLEATGMTKAYPGALAVDRADLQIHEGEIVGLLGKNGAGKSTLIKMLAGVVKADAGELKVGGEDIELSDYGSSDARRAGLAFMFQELESFSGLSVAENVMFGGKAPTRLGAFIRRRTLRIRVDELLASLEPSIESRAMVNSLSPAHQRTVMIARALYRGARVVVLDEPSTSLTAPEIEALHLLVKRLAGEGRSVIYVSHRLDEIMSLTDRVVIMRDGEVVNTSPTAETSMRQLIELISGHQDRATGDERRKARTRVAPLDAAVKLEVSGLSRRGVLENVSFRVQAGEILGIAGLVGAGRTELLRAIFGADAVDAGEIKVDGRVVRIRRPGDAIDAGVVLLPEDRRHQSLIETSSIRVNTTLASLGRFRGRRLPLVSKRAERKVTRAQMERLQVRASSEEQRVAHLSGGNQQKVVLAKWTLGDAQILMFDEPTQGIDIDAKEEAYRLMENLAEEGAAVIVVFSEFSELVEVCDRVVVLREGSLTAELRADEVTSEAIVKACYDGEARPGAHPGLRTGAGFHDRDDGR